jgi:hypothetical protein
MHPWRALLMNRRARRRDSSHISQKWRQLCGFREPKPDRWVKRIDSQRSQLSWIIKFYTDDVR